MREPDYLYPYYTIKHNPHGVDGADYTVRCMICGTVGSAELLNEGQLYPILFFCGECGHDCWLPKP